MVKAVALVGFYKGDLVNPGDVIELTDAEWSELKAAGKVEVADAQIEAEFKEAMNKELKTKEAKKR